MTVLDYSRYKKFLLELKPIEGTGSAGTLEDIYNSNIYGSLSVADFHNSFEQMCNRGYEYIAYIVNHRLTNENVNHDDILTYSKTAFKSGKVHALRLLKEVYSNNITPLTIASNSTESKNSFFGARINPLGQIESYFYDAVRSGKKELSTVLTPHSIPLSYLPSAKYTNPLRPGYAPYMYTLEGMGFYFAPVVNREHIEEINTVWHYNDVTPLFSGLPTDTVELWPHGISRILIPSKLVVDSALPLFEWMKMHKPSYINTKYAKVMKKVYMEFLEWRSVHGKLHGIEGVYIYDEDIHLGEVAPFEEEEEMDDVMLLEMGVNIPKDDMRAILDQVKPGPSWSEDMVELWNQLRT